MAHFATSGRLGRYAHLRAVCVTAAALVTMRLLCRCSFGQATIQATVRAGHVRSNLSSEAKDTAKSMGHRVIVPASAAVYTMDVLRKGRRQVPTHEGWAGLAAHRSERHVGIDARQRTGPGLRGLAPSVVARPRAR